MILNATHHHHHYEETERLTWQSINGLLHCVRNDKTFSIRSGSQATYAGAYIKLGIVRRCVLARLSYFIKRSVPARLSYLTKSYQRTEERCHKIKKNQRIAPPLHAQPPNEVKEWAQTKKALTLRAESSMISASNFCDCGRSL